MPSETFNRTDPDADELWAAFSLDELVSDGNPVPYGAKPVKRGPDPLVKHKKALKQPSYKVLTDRYGQQPNLPPVTNRSRLSKLADPMRGKFGNRVLDAHNNVQGAQGRKRSGRGDPVPEVNDYDDEPSGGGGGGAFFLTGADDEGEDYDLAIKKRSAKARQEKTSYGAGKASVGGRRGAGNASRATGVCRGANTERKPSALEQRAAARRLREMERGEANKPRAKVKSKTKVKKSMGASGGTQSTRGTRGASLERSGRKVGGRNTRRIPNDLASLRVPESQRVKHVHDRLGPRSKRELNDSLRSEGSRASGGRVSRVAGSSTGTTKPSRVRNLNKRGTASADVADISRKQPAMRQSRSSAGVATSRTAGAGSAALGRRGMMSSASAAGSLGTKKPSSVPTNFSARVARGGRVRLKQGIPSQARGTPSNAETAVGVRTASPRKAPPSSRPPLRPISGIVADANANAKPSSPKKVATKARGTFDSPPRYAPSMRKKETDVAIKAAGVKVDENAFSEMNAVDTGSEQVALKARAMLADAAKLVNADVARKDLKIIHETVSVASLVGSPSRAGVDPEGGSAEAGGEIAPEDAARRILAQAQMMTQSGMSVQDSIAELRRATNDASAKDKDKGVAKSQKQFVGQASRMMSKIQQAEEFSKKYSGLGGSGLDIGLE